MEQSLHCVVFEWRGRWHWRAEFVYPTPRSKVARRVHLRSDSSQGEGLGSRDEALAELARWLLDVGGHRHPRPDA